jgi:hypothetical protein
VAYLWVLCDALPGLKVPETVGWSQPLKHGTGMGLLLLAFRGFVIVPLAASAVGIWKGRGATGGTNATSTDDQKMPRLPAASE